jgi:hypothetical protein
MTPPCSKQFQITPGDERSPRVKEIFYDCANWESKNARLDLSGAAAVETVWRQDGFCN